MKTLNPLTGLRGIAAYSVLIAHGISASFSYSGINLAQPFALRLAYFGMSLFFVLSGFVIHYNYATLIRSEGVMLGGYQFIVARIARLYPLYALVILFSLDSIPSAIFCNKKLEALSYLTLTQSWFNLETTIFPPAWSISTEWFFYLAFILLLPLFEKIRRPLITLVIFLILTFLLLPYLIKYQISLDSSQTDWIIYFSPFTRIFDFIAGNLASVLYLSYQDSQRKIGRSEFIGLLFCIFWCAIIIVFNPLRSGKFSILISNFIFVPAIAPLLLYCCRYNTFVSRLLCSRPLMFIGEISYSVYLLGFMIIVGVSSNYVWYHATNMAYINSCIKIIIIITFTTFIAYGSYNLFEKPARLWVRKIFTLGKKKEITEMIPENSILQLTQETPP